MFSRRRRGALDAGSSFDGARSSDAADHTDSAGASDAAGVPSEGAPAPTPVGSSCVPTAENVSGFTDFIDTEVDLEATNSACASDVCLINHFTGRVSCPYGQSASGQGPDGSPGCATTESDEPVTGQVAPQCADRTAAKTVYCSCRCANAEGKTDDGLTYCACPGTMMCVQLLPAVSNLDGGPDTIGGAYCVKAGTEYNPLDAGTCKTSCDPTTHPCP